MSNTKFQLGKKSSKPCPECGGETVIEEVETCGTKYLERRCDSLIEVGHDKPLDACMWSEEINKNGKPLTHDKGI